MGTGTTSHKIYSGFTWYTLNIDIQTPLIKAVQRCSSFERHLAAVSWLLPPVTSLCSAKQCAGDVFQLLEELLVLN